MDTNIPKMVNRYLNTEELSKEETICALACTNVVKHVKSKGGLVLDTGNEILTEYTKQLSVKGKPGKVDSFMLWVLQNQWNCAMVDRVSITKHGDTYNEFPDHEGLFNFDPSDRKFVAVANAHPDKPPILQAMDSKWWGWAPALKDAGIKVDFVCEELIETMYKKKLG